MSRCLAGDLWLCSGQQTVARWSRDGWNVDQRTMRHGRKVGSR